MPLYPMEQIRSGLGCRLHMLCVYSHSSTVSVFLKLALTKSWNFPIWLDLVTGQVDQQFYAKVQSFQEANQLQSARLIITTTKLGLIIIWSSYYGHWTCQDNLPVVVLIIVLIVSLLSWC